MSPERCCLLLLNGELGDERLVRRAARLSRGVLCADGGLRHAARLKIEPDFVIGDMDSLPKPLPRLARALFWCDFDEQRSDFEKALAFAAEMGCRRAYVAGAFGAEADHVLVNLATARAWSSRLELILLGRGAARLLGPGRYALELRRGRRFSLLAEPPKAVVSLAGARYALSRETLAPGSRGLGNAATGRVRLEVHEGSVWLTEC